MKKSTITFVVAILGLVASLMAANLKLKSEYQKGNITTAYVKKQLPVFHFIKTDLDSTISGLTNFSISSSAGISDDVSIYYGDTAMVSTNVYNDTLFLLVKDSDRKKLIFPNQIRINTGKLTAIIARKGVYNIYTSNSDSLLVFAYDEAKLNITLPNRNAPETVYLSVNAEDATTVSIDGGAIVKHGKFRIGGISKLHISNTKIIERDLQMAQQTSLQLSGNSIDEFGIRR